MVTLSRPSGISWTGLLPLGFSFPSGFSDDMGSSLAQVEKPRVASALLAGAALLGDQLDHVLERLLGFLPRGRRPIAVDPHPPSPVVLVPVEELHFFFLPGLRLLRCRKRRGGLLGGGGLNRFSGGGCAFGHTITSLCWRGFIRIAPDGGQVKRRVRWGWSVRDAGEVRAGEGLGRGTCGVPSPAGGRGK